MVDFVKFKGLAADDPLRIYLLDLQSRLIDALAEVGTLRGADISNGTGRWRPRT